MSTPEIFLKTALDAHVETRHHTDMKFNYSTTVEVGEREIDVVLELTFNLGFHPIGDEDGEAYAEILDHTLESASDIIPGLNEAVQLFVRLNASKLEDAALEYASDQGRAEAEANEAAREAHADARREDMLLGD